MNIQSGDTVFAATRRAWSRVLLAVYLPPVFLGAMLMFWSEMLVAKIILPFLGGTPMVWTACMVFFQALLLAGYAYAHWSIRFGTRVQMLLYLLLVAASLSLLPVGSQPTTPPPAEADPRPWLTGWLALAVGGPFLVLSAAGPMLQAWFARSAHDDAANPYFLYVASNAGSLTGLLAFPVLAEPLMRLPEQSDLWSWLYVAFACLTALAALGVRRAPTVALPLREAQSRSDDARPTGRNRGRWIMLAFAPSSLLLGFTSLIATDIAAAPMIWMLPLAAYLLTFMIAFARKPLVPHWATSTLFPAAALPPLFFWYWNGGGPTFLMLAVHFVAFFLTALVCHGELARTRPAASHLTDFYLCLALGGAFGGLFNALVAPLIFSQVFEYPLAIVLALLLRPEEQPADERSRRLDLLVPGAWLGILLTTLLLVQHDILPKEGEVLTILGLLLGLFCILAQKRARRFALMAAGLVAASVILPPDNQKIVFRNRNFFGIVRVVDDADNKARYLYHGTTGHGAQHTDDRRLMPVSYYADDGPLGEVFRLPQIDRHDARVAAVGLGAGTIACLAQRGQQVTFFEIDPAVVRVAQDPALFTYLRDCPAQTDVVLGDGRLTLARQPADSFDLIVLDAFSSDAIPVHLLTREALVMYREKLKADGMIMFHISNRYLDLTRVLAPLARDAGLEAFLGNYQPPSGRDNDVVLEATWVLLMPPGIGAEALGESPAWRRLAADSGMPVWTDSFSNLLATIR